MFSFIILHYKNIEETINCLNCLKKFSSRNCNFIVVDNGTLSDSEEHKIKEFTEDVIKLQENKGFAKANNIGVRYAKEKYNSSFYIVLNSDVIIEQTDFIDIIADDYKKYKFDLLGPKIYSPTNESINPFPILKDISNVNAEIKRTKKLIKIYKSAILTFLLDNYLNLKKKIIKPTILNNENKNLVNVPLHGCCIIFSKKYVNKYTDVFYNETFLFYEEEFLYQRILKDNLISVYDNKLEIFHKEGASVKKVGQNIRKSRLFREEKKLESLILLKNYISS